MAYAVVQMVHRETRERLRFFDMFDALSRLRFDAAFAVITTDLLSFAQM